MVTSITRKGQVTIPKRIREALGVKPGDKVVFLQEAEKVILEPARRLEHFQGYFKVEHPVDWKETRKRVRQARARKVKKELAE